MLASGPGFGGSGNTILLYCTGTLVILYLSDPGYELWALDDDEESLLVR